MASSCGTYVQQQKEEEEEKEEEEDEEDNKLALFIYTGHTPGKTCPLITPAPLRCGAEASKKGGSYFVERLRRSRRAKDAQAQRRH